MRSPWLLRIALIACTVGLIPGSLRGEDERLGGGRTDEWFEKEGEEGGGDEGERLDRNVRIEFRLVPAKADDQPLFVVTAQPWYETGVAFHAEQNAMEIRVEGEVALREDQAAIFVSVEALMKFRGEGQEGVFELSTGVLLEPGKPLTIGQMGDRAFVLQAGYELTGR